VRGLIRFTVSADANPANVQFDALDVTVEEVKRHNPFEVERFIYPQFASIVEGFPRINDDLIVVLRTEAAVPPSTLLETDNPCWYV
jgi:hypothetical protein